MRDEVLGLPAGLKVQNSKYTSDGVVKNTIRIVSYRQRQVGPTLEINLRIRSVKS